MSSACFKHHTFIIRRTICTCNFFMVCFSCIYISSLAGGRMCSRKDVSSTWCSKHVEDMKNWIETLIWKSVHFVGLHYIIVSQCTVQKHNKKCLTSQHDSARTSQLQLTYYVTLLLLSLMVKFVCFCFYCGIPSLLLWWYSSLLLYWLFTFYYFSCSCTGFYVINLYNILLASFQYKAAFIQNIA